MRHSRLHLLAALLMLCLVAPFLAHASPAPPQNSGSLTLSRPIRTWEFLPVIGSRAALLGNEAGHMEAWTFPLKLAHDFHLVFHVNGQAVPAENFARTLRVRPESCTILYSGDDFQVRETLFIPVDQPGAILQFEIESEQPIEIEAVFESDLQLEWPAAIGGTSSSWSPEVHGFVLGEERNKFSGIIGSPTGVAGQSEYETNYSSSAANSIRLGITPKGADSKLIVFAGSLDGESAAIKTYQTLVTTHEQLLRDAAAFYQSYLNRTVSLELPDATLQQAYDWARVSVLQGLSRNPDLGAGLIAGFRTSLEGQRPGFAWFFGRDSLWTSLALNSEGDFDTTRLALDFLSRFQREDGKIAHEISQSAHFVNWFKDYPYAYASADATPLYLIAMNDYVKRSGDIAFAREKWDSLWKAYEYMRTTYDAQNFPQNNLYGHGWVEGGPLLPVKTEFYQSGLGAESLRSLANLANLLGKADVARELREEFKAQRTKLNDVFWSADKNYFAFALDKDNHRIEELSVLTTVPMWFGLVDDSRSNATITQLADLDHQTDWGMRILSNRSPIYSAQGYHFGSVWPLFTGWASVGEYRYHRAQPGYANLRANSLLALDGSLGHVTEVLSGTYYQGLATSSPDQIWSAAMIVSPFLRGMFGLDADVPGNTLAFAPHAPADWTKYAVKNVPLGNSSFDLRVSKTANEITLQVKKSGSGAPMFNFEPAVSLRARVLGVECNGRPLAFHVVASSTDQHVITQVTLTAETNTIRIRLQDDFGFTYAPNLPPLGSESQGLRILSESWSASHDLLTLNISGVAGNSYDLTLWNPTQIASVEGADLIREGNSGHLQIRLAGETSAAQIHQTIKIHFAEHRESGSRKTQ
jgi:glycogen debranching enzyme